MVASNPVACRRIGLLTPHYPPDVGGVAEASARQACSLAEQGADVTVIVPTPALPPAGLQEEADRSGLRVVRFGAERRPGQTRQKWFEVICTRAPWDLLHCFYLSEAGFVGTYAARYLSIPALVSVRGNDLEVDFFQADRFPMVAWTIARANHLTAVSTDLHRRILAVQDRPGVTVIPNAVDAEHFRPGPCRRELAAQWGLQPDRPVIGFVGEARLKKGLPTLLEAFLQVHTSRPEVQLALIGGIRASDRSLLELFQVQQAAAGTAVREIPYQPRDKLPDFYNLLDLVWLPSYRDGLPNSLLEAMACARPVIGTEVGGIPDVIVSKSNGFIVPPAQPEPLSALTLELLGKRELLGEIGKQARAHVLRHHRPEDERAAYERVYLSLWSGSASELSSPSSR